MKDRKLEFNENVILEDLKSMYALLINQWTNVYDLPDDPFSRENSIIIDNCFSWPLCIDP